MPIIVPQSLKIAQNLPLDSRGEVSSISNYKSIEYPFIGMVFSATAENKTYKVTGLAPGYLVYSTNTLQPTVPPGAVNVDYEIISDVYIDTYELYAEPETPESIKTKYESNAGVESFTDTEKTKLASIEEGAQVNPSFKTIGGESIIGAGDIPILNAFDIQSETFANYTALTTFASSTPLGVSDKGKAYKVNAYTPYPELTYMWDGTGFQTEGNGFNFKGKSTYESYLNTTTDNPVLTESQWVAAQKGEPGGITNLVDEVTMGLQEPISSNAVYQAFNTFKTKNLFNVDKPTITESPHPGHFTVIVDNIQEGESYVQSGGFSPYASWIDSNGNYFGFNWIGNPITAPTGAIAIGLRFANGTDLGSYQFEEGTTATSWDQHAYPRDFDKVYLKSELDIREFSDKSFNTNIDHSATSSIRNSVVTGSNYIAMSYAKETDEFIKSLGVEMSYNFVNTLSGYQSIYPMGVNHFASRKFRQWLYLGTIVSSNDPDAAQKIVIQSYWGLGVIPRVDTITELRGGTDKVFFVGCRLNTAQATTSLQVVIGIANLNNSYNYKISGFAMYDTDEEIDINNLIRVKDGSDEQVSFAIKKAVEFDRFNTPTLIDRQQRGLTVDVYGTSIDAMNDGGPTIWDRVAKAYGLNIRNHAVGGSRITFDTTVISGHDYVNSNEILPGDRSWSATEAERAAFHTVTNRKSSVRTNAGEIGLCYDNSMIPNIPSADIVIISTYGANDPHTMPAIAENACTVSFGDGSTRLMPNRYRLWELYRTGNQATKDEFFNRTHFFGALNFMIREIKKVKPTVQIILTGLNSYQFADAWDGGRIDDITEIVAELWQIPFIGMAKELELSKMPVHGNDSVHQYYMAGGDIHPWTPAARQWNADLLIRKLHSYFMVYGQGL